MALWTGSFTCLSFKRQLFEAVHDFKAHVFYLALYTDAADLTFNTDSYLQQGEVPTLGGYTAGGKPIIVFPPILSGTTALVEMDDVTWTNATFTARGAMCYNASQPTLPALFVLDFGENRISNAGNFVVRFPGPDPNSAILRIT